MKPAWFRSFYRWLLAEPRPISANPNPPPKGPPPVSQVKPCTEHDLSLVGTKALYDEFARRYDALMVVGCRRGVRDPAVSTVVVLCRGISDPMAYLRSAASFIETEGLREIKEGDL